MTTDKTGQLTAPPVAERGEWTAPEANSTDSRNGERLHQFRKALPMSARTYASMTIDCPRVCNPQASETKVTLPRSTT